MLASYPGAPQILKLAMVKLLPHNVKPFDLGDSGYIKALLSGDLLWRLPPETA